MAGRRVEGITQITFACFSYLHRGQYHGSGSVVVCLTTPCYGTGASAATSARFALSTSTSH